jgi:hypothetical protein
MMTERCKNKGIIDASWRLQRHRRYDEKSKRFIGGIDCLETGALRFAIQPVQASAICSPALAFSRIEKYFFVRL